MQRLREAPGVFSGAVDFEAQHAAAAAHLLHGQGALRMALKKGIVHAAHFGVCARNRATAMRFILPLHSHGERLDPAQEQPGGVPGPIVPRGGPGVMDRSDQILSSSDDPADEV